MRPLRRRLSALPSLLALACLALAAPSAAVAQDAEQPGAVEPVPGQAAPAPEPIEELPPASGTTEPAVPADPGATVPADPGATAPQTTPGPTATTGVPPGGTPQQAPAAKPKQDDGDGGVTWWEIGAIALAAIVLAALVTLVLWRARGWDPRWLRRWRHATAEAGYRTSLNWAEFRDFVRIGR